MPQIIILVSYLAVYARWIVGGLLFVAGIVKLRNVAEFVSTIQLFHLIPHRLSNVAAPLIIISELITGSCLLIGVGVRFAALAAAILLGIFALATLVSLARHNVFNCNCFGPYFKEKISIKTFIRSVLLVALCIWVVQFYDGYLALETWLLQRMRVPNHSFESFFLVTAIAILAGTISFSVKTILKNFKPAKS